MAVALVGGAWWGGLVGGGEAGEGGGQGGLGGRAGGGGIFHENVPNNLFMKVHSFLKTLSIYSNVFFNKLSLSS